MVSIGTADHSRARLRPRLAAATMVGCLVLTAGPAGAETINVTLDKARVLRVERPIATVSIGNNDIATVSVESLRLIFLTGKAVGETNLVILDKKGNEIANYDIVVAPETERHVTIHRGTTGVVTLSCDPRCTTVGNPKTLGDTSGGAAAPAAGGSAPAGAAPAAPAATPAK